MNERRPKITIDGPPSRCPECLVDYVLGKEKCSGCDNDFEGWERVEVEP